MKSAGKARNNGLYRHIRTSKEIIRNLLNDYIKDFMTCCIMESSATTATQLSRRLNATVLVLDELFFAKVNRTK